MGSTSDGFDRNYDWPPALEEGPPLRESDPVGATRGTINVTNSGSFTYSLPIRVPQGRNGLQPNLGVNYDSQASNGWLGVGFSLSGLSTVHRCDRTYAQDGEARGDDAWCLDEQRLIEVARDEYRTERESFARIRRINASTFRAERADGTVWHYGSSPSESHSVLGYQGDVSAIWVDKVEDRFGNYMRFGYAPRENPFASADASEGEYGVEQRINFIQYTGHSSGDQPMREVSFTWENRGDEHHGFARGRRVSRTERLRQITVRSRYSDVRRYDFSYEENGNGGASRLIQIQECDGRGVCKDPTRFDWASRDQATHVTVVGRAPLNDVCGDGEEVVNPAHPYVMDFNGDGAADLVYPEDGRWTVRMSAAGSMLSRVITTSIEADPSSNAQPLDYNQDGLGDLVLLDDNESNWIVLLSDGTDFQRHDTNVSYEGSTGVLARERSRVRCEYHYEERIVGDQILKKTLFLDFDGNGLTDTLTCLNVGGSFDWVLRRNLGQGWESNAVNVSQRIGIGGVTGCSTGTYDFAMDVDGDGSDELMTRQLNTTSSSSTFRAVHYSEGAFGPVTNPRAVYRVTTTSLPVVARSQMQVLDVNGDGLQDVVERSPSHGPPEAEGTTPNLLFVNTGGDFRSFPALHYQWKSYSVAFDYDGDGRQDLLMPRTTVAQGERGDRLGTYVVLRSLARRFAPGSNEALFEVEELSELPFIHSHALGANTFDQAGTARARVGDFNGDGSADILAWVDGQWKVFSPQRTPDRLTTVWEGFRAGDPATYSIDYAPLDDALYTRSRDCQYPEQCLNGRAYVVRSVYTDGGLDSAQVQNQGGRSGRQVHYRYEDARRDLSGRGFLGFARVLHSEDMFQSQKVVTHYRDHAMEQFPRPVANAGYGTSAWNHHYPYRGLVSRQELEVVDDRGDHDPSNDIMYKTVSTYDYEHRTFNWGRSSAATYGSFLTRSTTVTEQRRGGTSTVLRSLVSEVLGRDDFGNPLHVTTDDGARVEEIERSYRNDTQAWLVGLPLSEQITNRLSGTTSGTTQTYHHAYDATTGALQETIRGQGTAFELAMRQRYDRYGNVVRTEEDAGSLRRAEAHQYDALESMYVVASMNDLGHVTRWAYDRGLDMATAESDANGLTTRVHLDGFGRVKQVDEPDGSTTQIAIATATAPDFRYRVSVRPAGGGLHESVVDRWERPVRGYSPGTGGKTWVREWSYNRHGQLELEAWPREHGAPLTAWTGYVYDSLRRLVRTDNPDGTATSVAYDGFHVIKTDEEGNATTYFLDVAGRIVGSEDALGGRTRVVYGPLGDIRRIDDAAGNSIVNITDAYGRLIRNEDPNHGTREYTYDGFDRVIGIVDGNQSRIGFEYDSLDRQIERTDPDGVNQWTYDTRGAERLATTLSSDGVQIDYYYDALGREHRVDTTIEREVYTESQTYDAAGRVATVTYPRPTRGGGPSLTVRQVV